MLQAQASKRVKVLESPPHQGYTICDGSVAAVRMLSLFIQLLFRLYFSSLSVSEAMSVSSCPANVLPPYSWFADDLETLQVAASTDPQLN